MIRKRAAAPGACYCNAVAGGPRPGILSVAPGIRRRAMLVIALAYLAYFGVLVYSDLSRPEDLGVRLHYVGKQVYVSEVLPSSPSDRAGLRVGDRLTRLGSVHLGDRL